MKMQKKLSRQTDQLACANARICSTLETILNTYNLRVNFRDEISRTRKFYK